VIPKFYFRWISVPIAMLRQGDRHDAGDKTLTNQEMHRSSGGTSTFDTYLTPGTR